MAEYRWYAEARNNRKQLPLAAAALVQNKSKMVFITTFQVRRVPTPTKKRAEKKGGRRGERKRSEERKGRKNGWRKRRALP